MSYVTYGDLMTA